MRGNAAAWSIVIEVEGSVLSICGQACRIGPLGARLRRADCIEQCLSLGVKRKTYARTEFFSV
jgi:hypothetical protein